MPALVIALLLRLSPPAAAHAAAALEGLPPQVGSKLEAICHRESRCTTIRVHEIDAHLGRRGWRSQTRLGHLDPECQPYTDRAGTPLGWATRGPMGLSAASHWEYLPACYQPQILDVPLVSALVAARKWEARCKGPGRPGWCRAKLR